MATYDPTALTDSALAHKKAITMQQGRALRDNPIAIAEGALGAPKIASKSVYASAAEVTLANLGPFGGFWAWGYSPDGLRLAFSTDNGVSFSTPEQVANGTQMVLFLDFATGIFKSVSDGGVGSTGVLAGSSLEITHVSFTKLSAAVGSISVLVTPQGGESAS